VRSVAGCSGQAVLRTRIEKTLSPLGLGIRSVLDLHPSGGGGIVEAIGEFGDDTLKIPLTGGVEEIHSPFRDVIYVQQWRRGEIPQEALTFQEGHAPEIPTIEPQQIKGAKGRDRLPAHQPPKLRFAIRPQAGDFAIEDRCTWNDSANCRAEIREPLERVSVPGNELAPASFDIGHRSPPVILQFENPIGMIERRMEPRQGHRFKVWECKRGGRHLTTIMARLRRGPPRALLGHPHNARVQILKPLKFAGPLFEREAARGRDGHRPVEPPGGFAEARARSSNQRGNRAPLHRVGQLRNIPRWLPKRLLPLVKRIYLSRTET
jgi:hypothetical protein